MSEEPIHLTPANILQWLRDNPDEAKVHGIAVGERSAIIDWLNNEVAVYRDMALTNHAHALLGARRAIERGEHFTPIPLEENTDG